MSGSAAAAGVSAGLDMLSGIYGYLSSQTAASMMDSRARMIQMEAEANAARYAEQAVAFQASQSVQYTKSGVKLSGSPLDVLDETMRIAKENISAIRAGGAAAALDERNQGEMLREQGRLSLLSGFIGGGKDLAKGAYWGDRNTGLGQPRNKQNPKDGGDGEGGVRTLP